MLKIFVNALPLTMVTGVVLCQNLLFDIKGALCSSLANENLRNFQADKDGIVVLTL